MTRRGPSRGATERHPGARGAQAARPQAERRHPRWKWPDRSHERDACGIGFVAHARGAPSREIVDLALEGLARVRHRGAVAADADTGDGAGVLLPIPRDFLASEVGPGGEDPSRLGIAMVFVGDRGSTAEVVEMVETACRDEGLAVLAWRDVPVEVAALGAHARASQPLILQAILRRTSGRSARDAERRAHRARRRVEAAARGADRAVYVASCSFASVTYKALVSAERLPDFYPDLLEPSLVAPFAIFHQRYSTNTAPTWERAQPFRMLCHNGEINTIAGNGNRMRARERNLGLADAPDEALFVPSVDDRGSDSAILDEVVELLAKEGGDEGHGRDLRRVLAMLVPAAWEHDPSAGPEVRAFYRWAESLMEPWDGPAGLVFSDGVAVGAALDRNGLRPLRFSLCEDGLVVCASEAGAVDTTGRGAVRRGKLGPGQMLVVDPRMGGAVLDPVGRLARARPYGAWVAEHRVRLEPGEPAAEEIADLRARQVLHGYTREERSLILRPVAAHGKEPTFSMGDDTPIPPLGREDRPVFDFLRQRFAQVTNPAMDHLRERSVMSLRVLLGARDPLLWERPEAAALLEAESFFLWSPPAGRVLDATWPIAREVGGLREAVERLGREAVEAVAGGAGIVVVSDAAAGSDRVPIPTVLAVGAVNVALLDSGQRSRASIVADVDEPRTSHHVACLLAVGAEAIRPRLALSSVAELARERGEDEAAALVSYREAIEDGVRKVLAKLGISCIDSYRGAEAVDVLGLAREVTDRCFASTRPLLEGVGFDELGTRAVARHAAAYGREDPPLANPGLVKFRTGGEYHATNPEVVRAAHRVVDPELERLRSTAAGVGGSGGLKQRGGAEGSPPAGGGVAGNGDPTRDRELRAAHALRSAVRSAEGAPDHYARFAALVHERPPTAPRDLLRFLPAGPPLPLDEVEPASAILPRFSTGAISHGAISAEAHETLALAMHLVGGRSNTGEGGEDPARFRTAKNSTIKQVASGRFGVTPEYCSFAQELQIKIAQGSKPGEGGQLAGHKVTEEIARLRHTRPGVALISPAPHHDIYSIEDLAQLVFDLKQVSPHAEVSVKLVAEEGVGTVAVGVAKSLAEIVHIAGADGGTGASPLASIKHAGLPWELGLADAQRELAASGLRARVRLRADGGLKTGRDVVAAALLGADEFSFGTAALLAEGCLMVRTCHLDTCPVGIATQRPELRVRFAGTPEMVAAYLTHVAQEVRSLLAKLGFPTFGEAVGRWDLLEVADPAPEIGLADLLGEAPGGDRAFVATHPVQRPRSRLGDELHAEVWPALRDGHRVERWFSIGNDDRAVGARLGGAVGHRFGGLSPPGSAHVAFHGHAGQSFGAFLANGAELRLVGEANDYVGKGMGGGRIVIVPPPDDAGSPVLVGNTVLYGATGGELFVAGRAGERFAVRNSGATAVVEGVGDHGCEYMTGGTVVVLGPVGANLAAGMTGGKVYVHDPDELLASRLNPELAEARAPTGEELERLFALVARHRELTGSRRAGAILANRVEASRVFVAVLPRSDVASIAQRDEGSRHRDDVEVTVETEPGVIQP